MRMILLVPGVRFVGATASHLLDCAGNLRSGRRSAQSGFFSSRQVAVGSYRCARAAALGLFAVALVAVSPARSQEDGDTAREAAMVRFAQGVHLLEDGKAADAIPLLEFAWRESGREPRVGARLAQAYYAVRDVAQAERVAAAVLEADPSLAEMWQLRARLALAKGDIAGAIAHLEQARTLLPGSLETERMLAGLYAEQGDLDAALSSIDRCIQIEPGISDLHVSRGEVLVAKGRVDEAEAAFVEALALDPLDVNAVENLYDLYRGTARTDDALRVLEQYAARPGAAFPARMRLAQAYADAGRFDDAARLLEDGRASRPQSDEADLLLGRIYFEAKRYEDARKIFEPMYKKAGNSPELARIMGDLSLKTGKPKAARTYFERAIAWGRDDYRSYLAFFFASTPRDPKDGMALELSPDDRATLIENASRLAPRADFDAQFAVGMACSAADSLEKARMHIARANELRPGQQPVLFNLASVYEKMGRYPDAERVLVELHSLAPEDATICNFYGYLLALMKKDLDRAESLVRVALAKEPDNPFYIDSLGWVHYQRGEYARAVTELERAARIAVDDPVILEHLGDAYYAASRYREALAAYQQSVRHEDDANIREKITATQRHLR
jgi:tetratricopeptide (TPR) repeat protein